MLCALCFVLCRVSVGICVSRVSIPNEGYHDALSRTFPTLFSTSICE